MLGLERNYGIGLAEVVMGKLLVGCGSSPMGFEQGYNSGCR